MEQSKKNSILNFEKKIPEIQESLTTCKYLKEQNDEVDSDPIEINYELNDTLFTTAELPPKTENVLLWLGADIMLEYPIEEAIELLSTKLTTAKENLKISKEDCEFLRENITTMEVNTARLYNWDVEKRKKERLTEQTKNLKINSSNSD
ncbi:hypothetical protein WICMUC_000642 [Wickerhamomyces mucosus]|uniref:Prefoldin subunit 3 n=1 Tax=Wickerhamomyces mucosus TaxID=1378264 RepID=A0A9P8PZ19_9ASCO|nr:hypothetical protein WICMUC_000642 [Wickerhamomyces mucosus]